MIPTSKRRFLIAAILAVIFLAATPLRTAMAQTPPAETAALAGRHPAEYYKVAAALFDAGRKDEAVFVFYLGQLRYRVHLQARMKELAPDGDPAVFGSLSEVIGRPINIYAFGDIPLLAKTLEAVLAYDAANPDTFTPPDQFATVHESTRAGLSKMREDMLAQAESLREQRKANGLENRN